MKKNYLKAYQNAGVDLELTSKTLKNYFGSMFSSQKLPHHFFCNLIPLPCSKSYLALSADGVGTKVLLAVETERYETLGQDLVAMVYNDLITSGAKPFAFLDYYSTGKFQELIFIQILQSIQKSCQDCQMTFGGGESAEMPGLYKKNHFDLAGFGVGLVEENQILTPLPEVDQIIVGFPSSGFHSNGYSLIRKVLGKKNISLHEKYTFDGENKTLGEFLMEPTLIYSKILQFHQNNPHVFSGLAHISGGAYPENLSKILPKNRQAILWNKKFPSSKGEIFYWFQQLSGLEWREMYSIFNCGYGMVAVLLEDQSFLLKEEKIPFEKIGWIQKKKEEEDFIQWI